MNNSKPFMLRELHQGRDNKLITFIHGKVFFSSDPTLPPGWFAGRIIEESSNHGVFDATPLSNLPTVVYVDNMLLYAYIRADKAKRQLLVYPAKSNKVIYTRQLSKREAINIWGEDYDKKIIILRDGIKFISTKDYIPHELMREMRKEK